MTVAAAGSPSIPCDAFDPRRVAFFIPAGLKTFKLNLFERIGQHIEKLGGRVVRHNIHQLDAVCTCNGLIPIIGCQPESTAPIKAWAAAGKPWIYWDRGYVRRVFATWLPTGDALGVPGGYYRWHLNSFQMQRLDLKAPADRWEALKQPLHPWRPNPDGYVLIANGSATYDRFHETHGWLDDTVRRLSKITKRRLVVRDKETKRSLASDLAGALVCVSHGSIAAVESVILGTPVIVNPESAAALVGLTDLDQVEHPIYPNRDKWAHSLAYCQFNETELVDGTLWRLLR